MNIHEGEALELEPVVRMTRDMRQAAASIPDAEARYLVDAYYQMQRNRIRAGNQVRAMAEQKEPSAATLWLQAQNEVLEQQVKGALQAYAEGRPQGRWMLAQKGIGPVISAGFLAGLDLRPTVGAWWRFCGLDPTLEWKKGQKRPYNAGLKVLCWKASGSFVKIKPDETALYARLYRERKQYEVERDVSGGNATTAAETLAGKRFEDAATKAVYASGHLPPGRLDLRARRWTIKIFLSHLHHVWSLVETGAPPPRPFVIEHMGHAHLIEPPDLHLVGH